MTTFTLEAGRAIAINGKIVATLHKANGSVDFDGIDYWIR